jgi:hypothetical protein
MVTRQAYGVRQGLWSRYVAQSSSGQGLNCDFSQRTLYGRRFVLIRSASAMLIGLYALNPQDWSSPSKLNQHKRLAPDFA